MTLLILSCDNNYVYFFPEKMKRLVLLALLLAFVSCHETFVATNEWQEIKDGQKVPGGLHYRLNFETGKKEAKLLDPTDSDPDEPNQVCSFNQP